jgi:hypothetical protein
MASLTRLRDFLGLIASSDDSFLYRDLIESVLALRAPDDLVTTIANCFNFYFILPRIDVSRLSDQPKFELGGEERSQEKDQR